MMVEFRDNTRRQPVIMLSMQQFVYCVNDIMWSVITRTHSSHFKAWYLRDELLTVGTQLLLWCCLLWKEQLVAIHGMNDNNVVMSEAAYISQGSPVQGVWDLTLANHARYHQKHMSKDQPAAAWRQKWLSADALGVWGNRCTMAVTIDLQTPEWMLCVVQQWVDLHDP